jgi:hypothetical protein
VQDLLQGICLNCGKAGDWLHMTPEESRRCAELHAWAKMTSAERIAYDKKQGHLMDLSNYVDVPTRFAMALERWPELRLVENRPEIITIGDKVFISVTVQAWRTPDDEIPAQNTAWEIFPGATPFTRGSEMMNASTSALGRVLGFMMSFGPKMASAEEVRNRQTTNAPATLVRQPEKRPYNLARRKCDQCTI